MIQDVYEDNTKKLEIQHDVIIYYTTSTYL